MLILRGALWFFIDGIPEYRFLYSWVAVSAFIQGQSELETPLMKSVSVRGTSVRWGCFQNSQVSVDAAEQFCLAASRCLFTCPAAISQRLFSVASARIRG